MGVFALGAKHEDANFTAAAIMQLASDKPIHAFNPVNRATQTSLALNAAFIGVNRANSQFCGGAFTSAIWANDGDNFAFANAQINTPHKPAIVTLTPAFSRLIKSVLSRVITSLA